ncbi:hypothetical protein LTR78_010107 [Recurvomyces mirabilis]|uniref:Myb-like domain-containing protein n=2 Tax=Recurvomyces mirabilis TaxID=574656 RepID=A0AAE0TR24_9PEZI|nr:hypothetical protein LTR78_010107 [Recurvomyces mirabilis]
MATETTSDEYQRLLTQDFQSPNPHILAQAQLQPQGYYQQTITSLLLSQSFASELFHELNQDHILSPQMQIQSVQVSSSLYWSGCKSLGMRRCEQTLQPSRRRSHHEDFAYDYRRPQKLRADVGSAGTPIFAELTPLSHYLQVQPGALSHQVRSQCPLSQHTKPGRVFHTLPSQSQYHHHSLPYMQRARKAQRTRYGEESSSAEEDGPPSVVVQPGTPGPTAPQKASKLKFTPKDDALLVELKEMTHLTWKQIADFFPGRSSGTLQVRYCTKLKAKPSVWTDEMVYQELAAAEEESTEGG